MGLSEQVLVSCEHASNALPAGLQLPAKLRELHIAWDPGALTLARTVARFFGAALWQGRYSRLVVDLNRTVGNRVLMRTVSDGHPIPFNRGLSARERARRIERYYEPYRRGVENTARQIIARQGRCVHVCVHTFTPVLAGKTRGNDIGLLHDPGWGIERAVCRQMRSYLVRNTEYVVWLNRPYSGTADGILPAMRQRFTPDSYVGIELEVNQRHAGVPGRLRQMATRLCRALAGSTALVLAPCEAESAGLDPLPGKIRT